ncbi:MAG: HAMP domain-containing histidine kinase [Deltaproteobacteria bacterium]|nr:HAMP domain-containing histidine kinase [Deltaproteobacteria bacterium]
MDRVFDRVLLARHIALSTGAIAAYLFRTELRIGYMALWIVGISATLNFLAYVFRTRPGLAKFCMFASPVIGVTGWTALVAVTNGVASPFVAGLWLEIVLSAMALQLGGIVTVTLACVAGLWIQQGWVGLAGSWLPMVLQSGFLVGMGAATYLVTRRWLHRQDAMAQESVALEKRLDTLTRQLEDERVVAALGENVARLAHGLKNTVHSLRGFSMLIEPRLAEASEATTALRGLRSAIDDLESLAHLTLGSGTGATFTPAADERTADQDSALEAMGGEGHGLLESYVKDGTLHVVVADDGEGFRDTDPGEIFKPGFTTKASGSGYGLFLARRILEEHGGRIVARPRPDGGALIELCLPVEPPGESSSVH